MNTDSTTSRWGIALIRMTVGGVMLAHGLQKIVVMGLGGVAAFMAEVGIPWPLVSAVAATGAEVLGGVALLLGLYTRLAALPIAVTMLVAIGAVHLPNGFFLPNGIEYTLTLLAVAIGLGLTGSGALALDNWRLARATPAAVSPAVTRRAA